MRCSAPAQRTANATTTAALESVCQELAALRRCMAEADARVEHTAGRLSQLEAERDRWRAPRGCGKWAGWVGAAVCRGRRGEMHYLRWS